MALGKSLKIQGVSGEGVFEVQDDVSLAWKNCSSCSQDDGNGGKEPCILASGEK